MYYEEKVIDNVLHFRDDPDPDGDWWKPCSFEKLRKILDEGEEELAGTNTRKYVMKRYE